LTAGTNRKRQLLTSRALIRLAFRLLASGPHGVVAVRRNLRLVASRRAFDDAIRGVSDALETV
jgi:hypothetical protein